MLLIFDLDETLIYSQDTFIVNYDFIVCDHCYVKKRPHLDFFISEVVKMGFDIAVWTAGHESYATQVIEKIFDSYSLQFVYSISRCTERIIFNEAKYLKKLNKIWRKRQKWRKHNTLILDDNRFTYSKNYGNAIPIRKWNNKKEDLALLDLLPFLDQIRFSEDVSKVEKRLW